MMNEEELRSMTLEDRMKMYEHERRILLDDDKYVMCRLDGKSFSTYTKTLKKPFDKNLFSCFVHALSATAPLIPNLIFTYAQSDEITLVLRKGDKAGSELWFNGNLQKLCSVITSIFSVQFEIHSHNYEELKERIAYFDNRVWELDPHEVINCLIWRQQDGIRNAVSMYARAMFSHNEVKNKNQQQLLEMLAANGVNWSDVPVYQQRGWCMHKLTRNIQTPNGPAQRSVWHPEFEIPIFSLEKDWVETRFEPIDGNIEEK